MATAFPVSVKSFTEKSETNDVSGAAVTEYINGGDMNDIFREIISIETELGTTSDGDYSEFSAATTAVIWNQVGAGAIATFQTASTDVITVNSAGCVAFLQDSTGSSLTITASNAASVIFEIYGDTQATPKFRIGQSIGLVSYSSANSAWRVRQDGPGPVCTFAGSGGVNVMQIDHEWISINASSTTARAGFSVDQTESGACLMVTDAGGSVALTVNKSAVTGKVVQLQVSGNEFMQADSSGGMTQTLVGSTNMMKYSANNIGSVEMPIYTNAGDPSGGVLTGTGGMLYNPTDDKIYCYNGTAWVATAALT